MYVHTITEQDVFEMRFHYSLETETVKSSTQSLGQDPMNRALLSHEKYHWTPH